MLCDLARNEDVAIIDIDAIGAELGSGEHMPDGTHMSSVMEAEVRRQVLYILNHAEFPGSSPAASHDLEFDDEVFEIAGVVGHFVILRLTENGKRSADFLPLSFGVENCTQKLRVGRRGLR